MQGYSSPVVHGRVVTSVTRNWGNEVKFSNRNNLDFWMDYWKWKTIFLCLMGCTPSYLSGTSGLFHWLLSSAFRRDPKIIEKQKPWSRTGAGNIAQKLWIENQGKKSTFSNYRQNGLCIPCNPPSLSFAMQTAVNSWFIVKDFSLTAVEAMHLLQIHYVPSLSSQMALYFHYPSAVGWQGFCGSPKLYYHLVLSISVKEAPNGK